MANLDKIRFLGTVIVVLVQLLFIAVQAEERCSYFNRQNETHTVWKYEGEDVTLECPGYRMDLSATSFAFEWFKQAYNCSGEYYSSQIADNSLNSGGVRQSFSVQPGRISMDESGQLTIKHLTKMDEHTYTCIFEHLSETYIGTVDLMIEVIKPHETPTIWKYEGEDVTFTCPGHRLGSLPSSYSYHWYKQDYNSSGIDQPFIRTRIASSSYFGRGSHDYSIQSERIRIDESGRLTIRNLNATDEHTYTCLSQFGNLINGTNYTRTVDLKIIEFEEPKLIGLPKVFVENETAYAECEVPIMQPAAGFIEVRHNGELIKSMELHHRRKRKEKRNILDRYTPQVLAFQMEFEGEAENNVICTAAQNVFGEMRQLSTAEKVTLGYPYHTRVISSSPAHPFKFSDVILSCKVTRQGNPKEIVKYTWFKDGRETYTGQNITLRRVTEENAGSYQCLITSKLNLSTPTHASEELQLNVVSPHHTKVFSFSPGHVMEFSDVILSCEITKQGNPKEIVKYTWLKDGRETYTGQNITLRSVTEENAGSYQCLITNKWNMSNPTNASEELRLDVVPLMCLPQLKLKLIEMENEFLMISWHPTYSSKCRIHRPDVELIMQVQGGNETFFQYPDTLRASDKLLVINRHFNTSMNYEICLIFMDYPDNRYCQSTEQMGWNWLIIFGSVLGIAVFLATVGSLITYVCRRTKTMQITQLPIELPQIDSPEISEPGNNIYCDIDYEVLRRGTGLIANGILQQPHEYVDMSVNNLIQEPHANLDQFAEDMPIQSHVYAGMIANDMSRKQHTYAGLSAGVNKSTSLSVDPLACLNVSEYPQACLEVSEGQQACLEVSMFRSRSLP